jgi:TRAP-type C4-dicarboxylate transport system permease small subunit
MSKFLQVLGRVTAAYSRLLSMLLAASVAIIIIPVSLQIFSRYTALIPSYIWTEEMARFFFIWSIMIGAMVGIREGTHFVVDLWPPLNARLQAVIRLVAAVFVLVFAFVFLWWGIDFTRFAFNRISELAELPLWLIHIPWPLAGATWILFLGEQVWDDLRIAAGKLPPPAARPADEIPGSVT